MRTHLFVGALPGLDRLRRETPSGAVMGPSAADFGEVRLNTKLCSRNSTPKDRNANPKYFARIHFSILFVGCYNVVNRMATADMVYNTIARSYQHTLNTSQKPW